MRFFLKISNVSPFDCLCVCFRNDISIWIKAIYDKKKKWITYNITVPYTSITPIILRHSITVENYDIYEAIRLHVLIQMTFNSLNNYCDNLLHWKPKIFPTILYKIHSVFSIEFGHGRWPYNIIERLQI